MNKAIANMVVSLDKDKDKMYTEAQHILVSTNTKADFLSRSVDPKNTV